MNFISAIFMYILLNSFLGFYFRFNFPIRSNRVFVITVFFGKKCGIRLKLLHWVLRSASLYFQYEKGFPNLLYPEPYECCVHQPFCNPTQDVGMVEEKRLWNQVFIEQSGVGNSGVKIDETLKTKSMEEELSLCLSVTRC